MTENELIDFLEDEISGLKEQRDGVFGSIASEVFLEINGKERISKFRAIIGIITEIKQYRKLGTVEELKSMKDNGAFSTEELVLIRVQQMELEEYKKLGTVEECREAVDKTKSKKVKFKNSIRCCPLCGAIAQKDFGLCCSVEYLYCVNCGQRLENK